MAVLPEHAANAKTAVTHFWIKERYRIHTLLSVRLETGRTHQIRVHMAYKKMPIVGDPVYGNRMIYPPMCNDRLKNFLISFKRQALHACHLGLIHPTTRKKMFWDLPLPEDMQKLCDLLVENDNAG